MRETKRFFVFLLRLLVMKVANVFNMSTYWSGGWKRG